MREAVGIDPLALDQPGVAERGLLGRAAAIDKNGFSSPLLQVKRDADSDDSSAKYDDVALHHPLEAGIQTPILYRFGDAHGGNHVPKALGPGV
jgi:hypothetical protein